MGLLTNLKHRVQGKVQSGSPRSNHWPKVRKDYLAKNPTCAVCGGTKKLEVHHKLPFHLHPGEELNPDNLITLCESKSGGLNCHLSIGHLGSFKSYNENVVRDAKLIANVVKNRPSGKKAA